MRRMRKRRKNGNPGVIGSDAQTVRDRETARGGELDAIVRPSNSEKEVREIFSDIERIRQCAKTPKGLNVKELIEQGRV